MSDPRSAWEDIRYDDNDPALRMDRHRGRCHLCVVAAEAAGVEVEIKPITYCRVCRHWFDRSCRNDVFGRGIEFVRQLVKGPREGCCGPEGE